MARLSKYALNSGNKTESVYKLNGKEKIDRYREAQRKGERKSHKKIEQMKTIANAMFVLSVAFVETGFLELAQD